MKISKLGSVAGAALPFLMVACGDVPNEAYDVNALLAAEDGDAFISTCDVNESAGDEATVSEPYRKNPGVECTLISKFNGDIDAGFDMTGANYDAFLQCMSSAGCFIPGLGTIRSDRCDEQMRACQVHLVGAAAGSLVVERDFGTITADEWRNFGTVAQLLPKPGVVIINLANPMGPGTHDVEATKIEVSTDGKTVTATIRDPECPEKTSTMKIDVAAQKVTEHTGDKCHDYSGRKVNGITKISKRP